MSWYRLDPRRDLLTLKLHVQPNARRTELCGLHDGALKVRIAAPAVDDKANKFLLGFIGQILDLPINRVIITSGLHTRKKTVAIAHPEPRIITRLGELIT